MLETRQKSLTLIFEYYIFCPVLLGVCTVCTSHYLDKLPPIVCVQVNMEAEVTARKLKQISVVSNHEPRQREGINRSKA